MSKVSEVADQSFETEVINASVPVLVDFWAAWVCSVQDAGSCRRGGSREVRREGQGC